MIPDQLIVALEGETFRERISKLFLYVKGGKLSEEQRGRIRSRLEKLQADTEAKMETTKRKKK